MCPQVSFKIPLCWKYFITLATLIWFFTCVSTDALIDYCFFLNTWTHWLHWYGFSPLCVLRWVLRSLCFDHDLSHWLQWYVFSPVCVLKWILRILCVEYVLLQWLHWYEFSLVCVLRWFLRWLCVENILSRWQHHSNCINMVSCKYGLFGVYWDLLQL